MLQLGSLTEVAMKHFSGHVRACDISCNGISIKILSCMRQLAQVGHQ